MSSSPSVARLCAAVLALLAAPASGRAAVWVVDPGATRVAFTVPVLVGSSADGVFRRVAATIRVDEEDPARSMIEATIDAASIDTKSEERDRHLRSHDFLDVVRHPTIQFRSRAISRDPDGRWRIAGSLTLRGVTRDATLLVDAAPPPGELAQAARTRARATMVIDRREFGLSYRGFAWGREVVVTVDVEATRQGG
jgi:polyisoprenoid-binding protein YceI